MILSEQIIAMLQAENAYTPDNLILCQKVLRLAGSACSFNSYHILGGAIERLAVHQIEAEESNEKRS